MDLPPYLPTVNSAKCPACGQRIGMHLVQSSFVCPHCKCWLSSNVSRSFNEGAGLFALGVAGWFGFHALIAQPPFGLGLVLFGILAFYLGHSLYRHRLRLSKQPR